MQYTKQHFTGIIEPRQVMVAALCLLLLVYNTANAKTERVVFLLNCGKQMDTLWDGRASAKDAAASFIWHITDSLHLENKMVETMLAGYGEGFTEPALSCYNTTLLVGFSKDNTTQTRLRLNGLRPGPNASLAYAVKHALNNFCQNTSAYNYHIVVVTNSNENCGGNYCDELTRYVANNSVRLSVVMLATATAPVSQPCLNTMYVVQGVKDLRLAAEKIMGPYLKLTSTKPGFLKAGSLYNSSAFLYQQTTTGYTPVDNKTRARIGVYELIELQPGRYKITGSNTATADSTTERNFVINPDMVTEL